VTAKDYRQFWGLHRDLGAETQASLQKRGMLLCLCLTQSDSWIIIAGGQFIFSRACNGISIETSLLRREFAALQRGTLRANSRDSFCCMCTMCIKRDR
jgi:hypothetical protein